MTIILPRFLLQTTFFFQLMNVQFVGSFSPVRVMKSVFSTHRHKLALGMMKLDIVTRDFDLTPPISKRIDDKIGKAIKKFRLDYISSHIVLRLHKFPPNEVHSHTAKKDSQIAEVTVNVKGGHVIHVEERSDDMYATIDALSHKLTSQLRRFKEKYREKSRDEDIGDFFNDDGIRSNIKQDVEETDDDSEEEILTRKSGDGNQSATILKQKSFAMPGMTAEEAAQAFEFVQHPFYVFRNKETNEVNVLYRRRSGGVGQIMPKETSSSTSNEGDK